MRVLVIEDDAPLAAAIATGLRQEKMAVDVALDGLSGLERAQCPVTGYDVIILDRDLPGLHGDKVCARLGADDYLPKPFAFTELVARIRALLRRAQPALPPVLTHGDLCLDLGKRVASRGGRVLDLGSKEFGVLELLLAARGRAVSAEELLDRVWDEMADPGQQVPGGQMALSTRSGQSSGMPATVT